jgi:hypothetical protein
MVKQVIRIATIIRLLHHGPLPIPRLGDNGDHADDGLNAFYNTP